MREKTLFVVEEDGSAPSVSKAGGDSLISECRTAIVNKVVGNQKEMGLTRTTSPDDDALISSIAFNHSSKKIERAMSAVAISGQHFSAALDAAEPHHHTTPFVMAARMLQTKLSGNPEDGAPEVFEQLSGDIADVEEFVLECCNTGILEYEEVIDSTQLVLQKLCLLQRAVDHAPPSFLRQNEEILRSMRRDTD